MGASAAVGSISKNSFGPSCLLQATRAYPDLDNSKKWVRFEIIDCIGRRYGQRVGSSKEKSALIGGVHRRCLILIWRLVTANSFLARNALRLAEKRSCSVLFVLVDSHDAT